MKNLFNFDFFEFLELLNKHQVEYIIVGGYAVILHGYSRSTGDLDLWTQKTEINYEKLKLVYADFGSSIFPLEEFLNDKFDVWGIGFEPSKIEILTNMDGLEFESSYIKKRYIEIENLSIPFLDFEDLIKSKVTTSRFKDLSDIENLNKKNKK